MKAAILKETGGLYFEDVPRPEPKEDEVLLRVLVCGVCTSDMDAWQKGIGKETILGHEVVGIVEKTSSGISSFKPGERVTGSIMRGYAEYTVAKASGLIRVPDSLQNYEAIIEPCVCLLSGIERSGVSMKNSVAVIGAGYMGMCLIKLLQQKGVHDITVVDTRQSALENAAEMGASRCVLASSAGIREYSVVFETAGAASALDLAGEMCTQYGTLVIVGYHPCRREIDLGLWAAKAITVINSFEYRKQEQFEYMRNALMMVADRTLPTGRLMTHSFKFDDIEKAFTAHEKKEAGYLKSYIRIATA